MPESNLGYPFSVGASSVGYGQGWLSSTSGAALAATLHVMLFPWNIILRWISWVATLALSGLAAIGATPQGFIPVTKLAELNSIVNHMHSREDLYRRAIRELQEELESKDSDRKKAMRKLRANKAEISQLTDSLLELQRGYQESLADRADHGGKEQYNDHHRSKSGQLSHAKGLVHATFACLAVVMWRFSHGDHASLHWKLVFSCFFPLLWVYISWVLADRKTSSATVLLCAAWFLIGFAVALTLEGPPYHLSE